MFKKKICFQNLPAESEGQDFEGIVTDPWLEYDVMMRFPYEELFQNTHAHHLISPATPENFDYIHSVPFDHVNDAVVSHS